MSTKCPGARTTLFGYVLRLMRFSLELIDLARELTPETFGKDAVVWYGFAPVDESWSPESMLAVLSGIDSHMEVDAPTSLVGVELVGLDPLLKLPCVHPAMAMNRGMYSGEELLGIVLKSKRRCSTPAR